MASFLVALQISWVSPLLSPLPYKRPSNFQTIEAASKASSMKRGVVQAAVLPSLLAIGLLSPPALAIPPSMVVPTELQSTDEAPAYALNVNRRTSRRLASQVEKRDQNRRNKERRGLSLADAASSLCFGGSVFFFLGSRNSPLVPALGRALWDDEDEWLKDRKVSESERGAHCRLLCHF